MVDLKEEIRKLVDLLLDDIYEDEANLISMKITTLIEVYNSGVFSPDVHSKS